MKFVGINIILGLALAIPSHHLHAQTGCWNNKKMPKEWFVTALGGYTFGYGSEQPYWNRDENNLVEAQKFDVYYVNNARGWNGSTGVGVYLNKNFGLQFSASYLIGYKYKGTASDTRQFSTSYYSGNEDIDMDGYSAVSNYAYSVRTWSVVPALLYRFHFNRFYAFALLGLGVGTTREISNTYTNKRFYLNQQLVKEKGFQNSSDEWKKPGYIIGIHSGLGIAYPINNKWEILVQAIMKTQQFVGSYEQRQFSFEDYPLNGLEVSIGLKYNLFTSIFNKK